MIAYRLQADAFGDLDKSIQRMLPPRRSRAPLLPSTSVRLKRETASCDPYQCPW
jgi:hypothetical protein